MHFPLTLILATRNAHKAAEIQTILGFGFVCKTLADFPNAPAVVEDAPTFEGNATKKGVELARWIAGRAGYMADANDTFVLADDSGLEVDALNGDPGVRSARFAAMDGKGHENSPDTENNAKLLHLLRDVPLAKRSARFRCVLALTPVQLASRGSASPACAADELELQTELFAGACEGHIAHTASGRGGFGYDPLFIPAGYQQSFAELGEPVKNQMSHRARALEKLRAFLKTKTRGT